MLIKGIFNESHMKRRHHAAVWNCAVMIGIIMDADGENKIDGSDDDDFDDGDDDDDDRFN